LPRHTKITQSNNCPIDVTDLSLIANRKLMNLIVLNQVTKDSLTGQYAANYGVLEKMEKTKRPIHILSVVRGKRNAKKKLSMDYKQKIIELTEDCDEEVCKEIYEIILAAKRARSN
jgi:phosphoribosyl-AMP cyclohydrolase